jgi:hypothetical protein
MQKWLRKHNTTFLEVVEGSALYNFAYYRWVHFSSKTWRKDRSNRATSNYFALEHTRNPPARDVAWRGKSAPPYAHAEDGWRPAVPASCHGSYVWRIVGCGRCHTAFPRSPTPAPPSSIGLLAAARRHPSHPMSSCRTVTLLPWRARNKITTTGPAIKAMSCFSSACMCRRGRHCHRPAELLPRLAAWACGPP